MKTKIDNSIILIGFMGAGKSTVGRCMAEATGMTLFDTDEVVVKQSGRTISEIFRRDGEHQFRDYETHALQSLSGKEGIIVATGGGIVGREENWTLMRALGTIVYLRSDWKSLKQRLEAPSCRPLAVNRDWERIHTLFLSRIPLYEKADLIIDIGRFSASNVAQKIMAGFRQVKGC